MKTKKLSNTRASRKWNVLNSFSTNFNAFSPVLNSLSMILDCFPIGTKLNLKGSFGLQSEFTVMTSDD
jgi:hypothetical protein